MEDQLILASDLKTYIELALEAYISADDYASLTLYVEVNTMYVSIWIGWDSSFPSGLEDRMEAVLNKLCEKLNLSLEFTLPASNSSYLRRVIFKHNFNIST